MVLNLNGDGRFWWKSSFGGPSNIDITKRCGKKLNVMLG